MKGEEAFLILNVGSVETWDDKHGGLLIPYEARPTFVHLSRESAEKEAMRLQQANPSGLFAVFRCTHITASVSAPVSVTLGGKTISEQRFARLCEVVGDDLPF
jgi:hypothetical protein